MTLPDYDMTPSYMIFGATGGIGSEVAKRLHKQGARLVLVGRNPEKVDHLASELDAAAYTLDITDINAVRDCCNEAAEKLQRIDGVVNCVGSLLLKPAHLTSPEEWHDVIAKNLTSAFAVLSGAAKAMTTTGGSIVLVSSAAATTGLNNHEGIAAAKAGVIGLVRSAAATYASRGIRVNCVAPGLVQTPMTKQLTANENSRKMSEKMHALGRLGDPSDIASAIEWFLSPCQSWVTGQCLGVDGGLGTVMPKPQVN